MTDHDYLISIHACSEAVEWLGDRTGAEAWALCERADWMLWLVARIASRQTLVRAACACARTVLHLIQPGDDQPRLAIEAAEAWARGEASLGQVREAAEAEAAASASSGESMVARAAEAAAWAAWAGEAAWAAAWAAARERQAVMADAIRTVVSVDDLALTARAQEVVP